MAARLPLALVLILAGSAMLAQAAAQGRAGASPGAAVPRPGQPPAQSATQPVQQPVPSVPQQTTASFGDWTVRCTRLPSAAQACEAVQTVNNQGKPVAEVAFGRPAKGQPLRLTILVPPSVSFVRPPTLAPAQDKDPTLLELAWRRCLPGGCLADAAVPEELLRRLRGEGEASRVLFPDAADRVVALPFSTRGLPQALDALAKEEAG